MKIRWIKSVALVLAGAAVLVASACVGDDPAVTTGESKPDGERGGKCFPNKTCNGAALSCIDGVCILPGDVGGDGGVVGSEGGADGSTQTDAEVGDGGVDAATDGACPPPPRGAAGQVPCSGANQTCDTALGCCTNVGSCMQLCQGSTDFHLACESAKDCTTAPLCCLTKESGAFQLVPNACLPPLKDFKTTACVSAKSQCAGGLLTCSASEPCLSGSTCIGMDVELGPAGASSRTIKLGVCIPNGSP